MAKSKTCIFCKFYKQLTLEYGVCECSYNMDHHKHFLAPEHGDCHSWTDESQDEHSLDRLPDVEED